MIPRDIQTLIEEFGLTKEEAKLLSGHPHAGYVAAYAKSSSLPLLRAMQEANLWQMQRVLARDAEGNVTRLAKLVEFRCANTAYGAWQQLNAGDFGSYQYTMLVSAATALETQRLARQRASILRSEKPRRKR